MITGSGFNTNPGDVVWFCHLCGTSLTLPAGVRHVCESSTGGSNSLAKEAPRGGGAVGRFGWLLYRLGIKGLPGIWRLSGYARRHLDADSLCPDCHASWSAGDWFWRRCRKCAATSEVADA